MRCCAAAPLALLLCAVAVRASDGALPSDSGAAELRNDRQQDRRPSQEDLGQVMAHFDADVDAAARLLLAWIEFLEQHYVYETGFFPAGFCEADACEKAAQLLNTFCMAARTLRLELAHMQRLFCAHHGLGDVDVLALVVPAGRSGSDTTPNALQEQTLSVNLQFYINMLRVHSASMERHMADVRAFFDATRTPAERAAVLAEFRNKNSTGGVLVTFKSYHRCLAFYVGMAAQFLAEAARESQPIDSGAE